MINSNGIKILCYIIMGIAFIASIAFIVVGILGLVNNQPLSALWILAGICSPLITSVSLYPIFALANIEENVCQLSETLNKIINKNHFERTNHLSKSANTNYAYEEQQLTQDIIDFINSRYQTQINIYDSLDTIKFKISSINATSSSVNILTRKVAEAQTISAVAKAFVLHRATNE